VVDGSTHTESEGGPRVLSSLRVRMSFANVMSLIALFVALGGTGYASGILAPNSVGTAQLKADAVTSSKVKDATLKAADFGRGQLKAGPAGSAGAPGPAGPAGAAGVVDPSLFYSKAQSNARFLGGALVTVIATSGGVAGSSFGSATATCPAGYQVISGGEDSSNVLAMLVAGSEPLLEDSNLFTLPEGQHGAPNAWRVFMFNTTGSSQTFKVVAICAPVG
jgi:hypothetical protein